MAQSARSQLFSIVGLVLSLLLFDAAPSASASGGLRFTIMVSKFENQVTNYQGQYDLGSSWQTIMTAALGENEHFLVIGEHDMRNEALAEQAFAASGATVQGHKTPQRGQMAPAQLLVKGVITHYEQSKSGERGGLKLRGIQLGGGKEETIVRATVYVIDSATGMVVASKNFEGNASKRKLDLKVWRQGKSADLGQFDNNSASEALIDAIDQAIVWLETRLPSMTWRGEIVLVKDREVIVNRGSREGVRAGEKFIAGELILLHDPDTGEVLDHDIDVQAELVVARVRSKVAYCRVVDGDPTLLYEGMGIARTGG